MILVPLSAMRGSASNPLSRRAAATCLASFCAAGSAAEPAGGVADDECTVARRRQDVAAHRGSLELAHEAAPHPERLAVLLGGVVVEQLPRVVRRAAVDDEHEVVGVGSLRLEVVGEEQLEERSGRRRVGRRRVDERLDEPVDERALGRDRARRGAGSAECDASKVRPPSASLRTRTCCHQPVGSWKSSRRCRPGRSSSRRSAVKESVSSPLVSDDASASTAWRARSCHSSMISSSAMCTARSVSASRSLARWMPVSRACTLSRTGSPPGPVPMSRLDRRSCFTWWSEPTTCRQSRLPSAAVSAAWATARASDGSAQAADRAEPRHDRARRPASTPPGR